MNLIKKSIFLLLGIAALSACSEETATKKEATGDTEITINSPKIDKMTLFYPRADGKYAKKTATTENGVANITITDELTPLTEFKVVIKSPKKSSVETDFSTYALFFASKGDHVVLNIKGLDNNGSPLYTVSSNNENKINDLVSAFHEGFIAKTSDYFKYKFQADSIRKSVTPKHGPSRAEQKNAIKTANKILKKDPNYLKTVKLRMKSTYPETVINEYIKSNKDLLSLYFLSANYYKKAISDEDAANLLAQYPESLHNSVFYKDVENLIVKRNSTKVGKTVPNITSTNIDGKEFNTDNYKGEKYLLIDFWATWCGPCKRGYPEMNEFYLEHKDKLEMVSICCSDTEANWRKFFQDHPQYKWEQIQDPKGKLVDEFSITGYPTKIIVNKEGVIVYRRTGERPTDYKDMEEALTK